MSFRFRRLALNKVAPPLLAKGTASGGKKHPGRDAGGGRSSPELCPPVGRLFYVRVLFPPRTVFEALSEEGSHGVVLLLVELEKVKKRRRNGVYGGQAKAEREAGRGIIGENVKT